MKFARIFLSFAVSLLFLYLTFFIPHFGPWFRGEIGFFGALFGHARFNVAELGRVLAGVNWTPICWAGALFFGSMFVRAWRWQIMLEPVARMRFMDVFGAMSIGYMANNVLPLRMGEVYRAHVVHQLSGASRSAAFGSIVLERVTDLFFMLPFMGLAFVLFPLPGVMQKAALWIGIVAFLIAGFLLWLALDRKRATGIASRVFRLLPRKAGELCTSLVDRFASGLGALGTLRRLWPIVLTSPLLWVMYAGMVYFVLQSLGFMDAGLAMIETNPLGAVLVILIVTTVGFVIPGAPGAVGTYHGVAVLALSLFGVPGDRAAGFAILLHALNYIPLTAVGLVFFWKLGLTFRRSNDLAAETNADLAVRSE